MTLLASWGKTAAVVGLVADFGLIKNIHPKLILKYGLSRHLIWLVSRLCKAYIAA